MTDPRPHPLDTLPLPAAERNALQQLTQRLRNRPAEKAPSAARLSGAALLVTGPGAPALAEAVARDVGLLLLRVDLSRVVSQYLGETEKNLSRLFDEAAAAGSILFFDEADALFGNRTDVKESHDRYATAAAHCLLQRIEAFHGVVIVATARELPPDPALLRLFHCTLHPRPVTD